MFTFPLQCILSQLKNEKKVIIIGYSLGSILAIELIGRLEAASVKTQLFLIDGAPEYIKRMIELDTSNYTSAEEFEIYIIIYITETYDTEFSEEVYIIPFFIFLKLIKL